MLIFSDVGIKSSPVAAAFLAGETASIYCTVKVPDNLDSFPEVNWLKADGALVEAKNFASYLNSSSGLSTMTFTR